jgi:protein SCO1/2
VVVVTGVYAHCVSTCPMILLQAKSVLAELTPEERASVTVVAVTLDPERDRPPELAALALRNGVHAPSFRLATGDPAAVGATLDAYGISRRRDAESGVIDHANLFAVIDRDGRIAYRFTLGELQRDWLARALRLLIAEEAG